MKRLKSYLLLNVVGYGNPGAIDTDFPGELQISNGDECVWYVPISELAAARANTLREAAVDILAEQHEAPPTATTDAAEAGAEREAVEPGSYKRARGVIPWKEGDEDPVDTIRRMRGHSPEIEAFDRLRAEVARVTAQAEKRADLIRERRDFWHEVAEKWERKFRLSQDALAAERDAHERTQQAHAILLQAASDALADEERDADGLASTMLESASILDLDEHTDEIAGVIRDLFSALATHDARRASEKGADGE